jgi:GTPase SAR1 family protein
MSVNGSTVKLQFWDTDDLGFQLIPVGSYYKSTSAIFLVYDVTSQASFKNCVD